MKKAAIIQRRFRLFMLKSKTSSRLNDLRDDRLNEWRAMQNEFKAQWSEIKESRRIEIHINSFSISEMQRMTIEKYKQKENAQIARLFGVKDPNVNIIYICPFPLTSEIYNYYLKILELVEIEHPEKRFHVIVPENYTRFSSHLSLTQALLYSPLALKQVRDIIRGKQSYIVPGRPSDYDMQLSMTLRVPLMSGEPALTKVFSTKSGAKRIFQLADVPVPLGAYDIYSYDSFCA